MPIQNNQLDMPFSSDDKSKLDGITPGAEPQPATASQAEAEAGTDLVKMMPPLRVKQAILAAGAGSGEVNTGGNLGSGTGLFAQKFGVQLQFKSLVAGTGVTISANTNTISISASTSSETNSYLNNSGSTIPGFILVRQDSSGNINTINASIEAQVINLLGILLQDTDNGDFGSVALGGLITNITTSFVVGSVLYLSKTGTLSSTVPEIGTGSFVAGDFIVKAGRVTKNLDNPSNKDFKVEIEIIGQL